MLELTKIAGNCKDGDCPQVFRTNRGTIAVQGNTTYLRRSGSHEAVTCVSVLFWI